MPEHLKLDKVGVRFPVQFAQRVQRRFPGAVAFTEPTDEILDETHVDESPVERDRDLRRQNLQALILHQLRQVAIKGDLSEAGVRNHGVDQQQPVDDRPGQILGCATILVNQPVTQIDPNVDRRSPTSPTTEDTNRKLLVFFDGSANDWQSRTNVRRLFEIVAVEENPEVISIYMDGVGSSSTPLTGGVFGFGMKARIMEGYKFLARNRGARDKIYIFGFSRGAHQARSLVGLLAYCGLPKANSMSKFELDRKAEEVWDACGKENEVPDTEWRAWKPENGPWLAQRLRVDTDVAEVEFLGIWDTVPGSQFKKFDNFDEAEDEREGIRCKVHPYPTIHVIAHALSRWKTERIQASVRKSAYRSSPYQPAPSVVSWSAFQCGRWLRGFERPCRHFLELDGRFVEGSRNIPRYTTESLF